MTPPNTPNGMSPRPDSTRVGLILRIAVMCAVYFGLSLYGGEVGRKLLYPIRIFVTFLHEFGHAAGALITGGEVVSVVIEQNGAGATATIDGSRAVILMGGYLGSALFGNILFYIGARAPRLVKPALIVIIAAMAVTGIIWYWTVFTTFILFVFSAALFVLGFKTKFGREILMFLGLISVIYIIQDTASGPSSDLRAFEEELRFFPAKVWMLIWLALALGLLAVNARMLWGEGAPPKPRKKAKAVT